MVKQATEGGAQLLQVFETVGVDYLSKEKFMEFSFPYLKRIADGIKEKVLLTDFLCLNIPY
jgi:uroporphyrinogen-III decarboxylase